MALIEIACFQLNSSEHEGETKPWLSGIPYDKATAAQRALLSEGMRALSRSSKNKFHLFQDIEDPQLVYYIGRWHSKDDYRAFFTSTDRGDLVNAIQNTKAQWHWKELYEVVQDEHFTLSSLLHSLDSVTKAKLVGITRHNVVPTDASHFESTLLSAKGNLEKFSGFKTIIGRQIQTNTDEFKEPDVEHTDLDRREYAVLSGWPSKERRDEFPSSEEFGQYSQIRSWAKWFERRSAVPILLE